MGSLSLITLISRYSNLRIPFLAVLVTVHEALITSTCLICGLTHRREKFQILSARNPLERSYSTDMDSHDTASIRRS